MKAQSTNEMPLTLDQNVETELIGLTWRNATTAAIIWPLLVGGMYFGIAGKVPTLGLWVWAGAMSALVAFRIAIVVAWHIGKPQGRRRLRWGWYNFAIMLLIMAVWGATAPVFLHQLEPLRQAFVLILICGTLGASVAAFSSHRLTMLIAPPAALLPAAAASAMMGGETLPILAALLVLYCGYLVRVGMELHRTSKSEIRLRLERSEMVDKLSAARDAAEQANEAKSLFLANMSHELRTPLNAIMGFSEMIELGILGKENGARQTEYAKLIHGSGAHLLDLINDLLDVSKAEAGKLDLHEEELDLGELVDNCLQLLAPAADKAKVHLEGPASKQTFKLNADDRKLRQILINLLSNAMKFTPEGGSVSISYAGNPDGGVTISVADSGIGMTPEQLEKAMQPFVRIEQGYDSNVQGTGLGLPLSKTLTELHGGRFEMQSAPGKGTTAFVHLPAERLIEMKTPRKRAAA